MEPTNTIIARSTKIGIRVSDYKPGVIVQTQTKGIEFDSGVRYATGDCPKCGHSNSGIYYPRLRTRDGAEEVTMAEYLKKHGAELHCCACGIPYKVEIAG